MNQNIVEESKADGDMLAVKFKFGESLEFVPRANLRLKIERKSTTTFPLNEFRVEAEYRVWFLFTEAKSAQEIRNEYIPVFLRLLCVLTNGRVFAEKIAFFEHDPFTAKDDDTLQSCELLFRNEVEPKQKTRAPRMLANFREIASDFDSILKRWFECHERMEPVMDLYFAVLSNRDFSYQTKFLLLAQALEVYHARSFSSMERTEEKHAERMKTVLESAPTEKIRKWLEYKLHFSNQKTLGQRIKEILNCDEAQRLTAKIDNFADKVRDSRNYYTHYSEKLLDEGNVAKSSELIEIGFILEDLLKICLLKELGIRGKPVEIILAQNASSIFTHLETIPVSTTKPDLG